MHEFLSHDELNLYLNELIITVVPVQWKRPRKDEEEENFPLVHDLCAGHEVVIVKNGMRVCGSGGALASAPLVQSKSYFEVKLQQSG
uniref:Uncharacterized protein n=1 Tax=Timema bartmani TaxID=61472 RepID=A0A7R9EXQ7_9NEOP|nr:unnamed protein product [Timema bartmani]